MTVFDYFTLPFFLIYPNFGLHCSSSKIFWTSADEQAPGWCLSVVLFSFLMDFENTNNLSRVSLLLGWISLPSAHGEHVQWCEATRSRVELKMSSEECVEAFGAPAQPADASRALMLTGALLQVRTSHQMDTSIQTSVTITMCAVHWLDIYYNYLWLH